MSQDEEDRMRQAFREHVASGPSFLNEEAFIAAWRGSKGRPRLDDHLDRFELSADSGPDSAEKSGAEKSAMTISGIYTKPSAVLRCEESGHEIVCKNGSAPWCPNCGLRGPKLLLSAGFVRDGEGRWVRRG